MNILNRTLVAVTAASLSSGAAYAVGLDGYVAEVVVMQGDRVVARTTSAMPADGVLRGSVDRFSPYRKSVSYEPGDRSTTMVEGSVKTGSEFEIDCIRSGEELVVKARAVVSELVSLDTFSTGGRTIDLPTVHTHSLRDAGVATREGQGWAFKTADTGKDLTMSVKVKPGSL